MIHEEHLLDQKLTAPVNHKVSLIQSILGNIKSLISKVKSSKQLQIENAKEIENLEPISGNAIESLALPMLKKSISDPIKPALGDYQEIKDLTIQIEPNSVNLPMKKDYKKGIKCDLCCSQIKDTPHLVNCCCNPSHFHAGCAFQFLKSSAETVFKPIICPVGCERQTKLSEIEQICDLISKIDPGIESKSKEITRYISHNKILSDPTNLFICPYANCLGVISRVNHQQEIVNCPSCKKEICIKCDRMAHKGSECMKFLQEENKELDKKFDEEVKNRKYQTCPGCIKVISRVDGCRCMTCICGTEFCYWCGKILNWDYPEGDEYCRCNDDAMEELDDEYYL